MYGIVCGKYYGGQPLRCICSRHGPSQGLITVVLLISWLDPSIFTFGSHVEVVDMFAGAGRIARMARQAGQKAVALDIVYSSHSHCFDINEDAGFAFLHPNRILNMHAWCHYFHYIICVIHVLRGIAWIHALGALKTSKVLVDSSGFLTSHIFPCRW